MVVNNIQKSAKTGKGIAGWSKFLATVHAGSSDILLVGEKSVEPGKQVQNPVTTITSEDDDGAAEKRKASYLADM